MRRRRTVAHDKSLNGVAVAPHLRMVATCSSDKTAKIWKMPDLVPLATLRGHRRGVWACAFSPSDRVLATAGGDKTVKIWSVDDRAGSDLNGACLRTARGSRSVRVEHRFLSRGTQLLTTGETVCSTCGTSPPARASSRWTRTRTRRGRSPSRATVIGSPRAAQTRPCRCGKTPRQYPPRRRRKNTPSRWSASKRFFNAERSGEVAKAIELALSLERPGALLRVLTRMLEEDYEHGDARLRQCVTPLRDESLTRMLKCVREWNTNGRTCHVAQHVLAAIFRTHSMEELSKLEGIEDIMHACRAYTDVTDPASNGCIAGRSWWMFSSRARAPSSTTKRRRKSFARVVKPSMTSVSCAPTARPHHRVCSRRQCRADSRGERGGRRRRRTRHGRLRRGDGR